MLWLADENFDRRIVDGVRKRKPTVEIARVQELGLGGISDEDLLEWAARGSRVLLSHDANTMVGYAHDRLRRGQPMPGVFECGRRLSIGVAIEEILTIDACSEPEEWENRVTYLPL